MAEASKRYAVVTGANKGIGFEICRQLALRGIMVVLTARDEKRGLEALHKLKNSDLSEFVIFHQLDVADISSIAAFTDFMMTKFRKLDILVNNAGIFGAKVDVQDLRVSEFGNGTSKVNWHEIVTQTYELAEECLTVNYYGARRMVEALIPLLRLSDSPRIVNISSYNGKLAKLPNEWARKVLGDTDELSEERIDDVLMKYLKDFKEGSPESKGWPVFMSANTLSKAALNSYTRLLAKRFPTFRVNCVCPGYVRTDINFNTGILSVEEGAENPVRLALLPDDGPSGCFFERKELSGF